MNLPASPVRPFLVALLVMVGLLAKDCLAGDAVLIKDITKAGFGSSPNRFFELGPTRILFSAVTSGSGREPWVTDGTWTGTRLLADILPGTASSNPGTWTKAGSRALFLTSPTITTNALWITDGTPTGTAQVLSATSPGPRIVGQCNGRAILESTVNGIRGLYSIGDGTDSLQLLVAGLTAGNAVPYNGYLVFSGNTAASGSELWRSDGTPSGTSMIRDILPGSGSSFPGAFAVVGSQIYFAATTNATGFELWTTDGTTAGTVLAADIRAGGASSSPSQLLASAGSLFFVATDSDGFKGVFSLVPGATPVEVFADTSGLSFGINSLTAFRGGAVFVSSDQAGSPNRYFYVCPQPGINALPATSLPLFNSSLSTIYGQLGNGLLLQVNGTVTFSDLSAPPADLFGTTASSAVLTNIGSGRSLVSLAISSSATRFWVSDGTAQGTQPIASARGAADAISLQGALQLSDGRFVFCSYDPDDHGNEPWITDSTLENAHLIRDLYPDTGSTNFYQTWMLGERFCGLISPSSGTFWTSSGTPDSTQLALNTLSLATGSFGSASGIGGRVYFTTWARSGGGVPSSTLYQFDGSLGGPTRVYQSVGTLGTPLQVGSEIWCSRSEANPGIIAIDPAGNVRVVTTRINDTIFRAALSTGAVLLYNDGAWFSNGTDTGTLRVWPACATPTYSQVIGSGTIAYFAVQYFCSGSLNFHLWRTDGTSQGTRELMSSGNRIDILGPIDGNDILMFAAPGTSSSPVLYRTTGSGNSFEQLSSVSPATLCSPNCPESVLVNGAWLFSGRTSSSSPSGGELWRSDGTVGGTYLVADLVPGPTSSIPRKFWTDGEVAWFVAFNSTGGSEIWKTDGTPTGTVRASSLYRNVGVLADPTIYGVSPHGLFFSAVHPVLGRELYVLKSGSPDCNQNQIHDQLELERGINLDGNLDGFPDDCCPPDFDFDGRLAPVDIFAFLSAWFGGEPRADFDHSGALNPQDIFSYLSAWFVGCP